MAFEFNDYLTAFLLTLFAGLSTGIGSLIVLSSKELSGKVLAFILGFSAGVMMYVAFFEMLFIARTNLTHEFGESKGILIVTVTFFAGIILSAIIDKLIPENKNPHEYNSFSKDAFNSDKLLRTGIITAVALAIHNFPEGFVTFSSALIDPQLGLSVAVAVAIHNIPEGIAVAVPIFFATKSKKRAIGYSFLSGLAEPLGAIVGFIFFYRFLDDVFVSALFGIVAGIMVFISLDELLPTAEEYGEHHYAIYGVVMGMAVMAISLIII